MKDSIVMKKIPDEIYFSEEYADYISNSRLSLLKKSPDNPTDFFNGFGTLYTQSLERGSAVHELVLQPEYFALVDGIDKPSAKTGVMADELYSASEPTFGQVAHASVKYDYYANSMDENKYLALLEVCRPYWKARYEYEHSDKYDKTRKAVYMDPKSRETVKACVKAVNGNKNIQALLADDSFSITGRETAILMNLKVTCPGCEPFILKLKSKLDHFSIDPLTDTVTVNDLKTTGRPIDSFDEAIDNFSYYREMAMYAWLLTSYAKKELDVERFSVKSNFLTVQTFGDFPTRVFEMTPHLFRKGFSELIYLIKLISFYLTLPNYEQYRFKLQRP